MATFPADSQAVPADDSPGRAGDRGRGGRRRAALLAAVLAAGLASLAAGVPAQSQKPAAKPAAEKPQKPQTAQAGKPAPAPASAAAQGPLPNPNEPSEKAFKNIHVLQGMPAGQMGPVMHVMRASLGVRCDYCHVIEDDRYDLDTKPAKEVSRQMVRMVQEINKANFGGQPVVTCQTCHHGEVHPSRVPSVELGLIYPIFPGVPLGGPSQEALANLPSAAEVLDHYIEALGGRAALEKVHSRVSRGELLHLGIVEEGTPRAHGVARGQADPLEIVQRLPDKLTLKFGPAAAQTVQTVDGASGTVKTPKGQRPLAPAEAARLLARFDLRKDLKLREQAESAQVIGRDKIDGREVVLLRTEGADGVPVIYSFDSKSGLLLRQVALRPTVIGPEPEQLDYSDYRDVGGVKVPFVIKTSYLDDLHSGTTRKLTEVRNNTE
jgi:hypothetical protein